MLRGDCLLAVSVRKLSRLDDAEPLANEAMALFEKRLGPLNPRLAAVQTLLGGIAKDRGRFAKTEAQ